MTESIMSEIYHKYPMQWRTAVGNDIDSIRNICCLVNSKKGCVVFSWSIHSTDMNSTVLITFFGHQYDDHIETMPSLRHRLTNHCNREDARNIWNRLISCNWQKKEE